MQDHYSDISQSVPSLLRFSQVLNVGAKGGQPAESRSCILALGLLQYILETLAINFAGKNILESLAV